MEQTRSDKGQIRIYVGKCFRIFQNENGWKSFVSTLIIVLIISCVTGSDMFAVGQATQTGAFALVCACIWVGIFNSIQSVCKERAIVKREHRTGLRISSYIVAHLMFEAVICLGEAVVVTAVTCLRNFSNLPTDGVMMPVALELFIDFYLIILASDMMGMLVSCIVKTETEAMTVMPFVLILQLVLAGMIFELEGVSKLASNLTISRWGLAAICVTANVDGLGLLVEKPDYAYTVANELWLWLLLVTFIIVLTVFCIAFLSMVDKDKR